MKSRDLCGAPEGERRDGGAFAAALRKWRGVRK